MPAEGSHSSAPGQSQTEPISVGGLSLGSSFGATCPGEIAEEGQEREYQGALGLQLPGP